MILSREKCFYIILLAIVFNQLTICNYEDKKKITMVAVNDTNITTRTRQKQITRQRLIEATFDVIAEEGFTGVTMAKVAERAGLSR